MFKKYILFVFISALILGCKDDPKEEPEIVEKIPEKPVEVIEFGFNLNNFLVKRDTIEAGDTFGEILTQHNIGHRKIHEIAEKTKDIFNVKRIRAGKPYTLLFTKDSVQELQYFIYQYNNIDYAVINLADSIYAYKGSKPFKIVAMETAGIIFKGESLNTTLKKNGLDTKKYNKMVELMEDVYQWTISFYQLQPEDRFKIVYTQKYISDTIPDKIETIRAAYFEHRGTPIYAFEFENDTIHHITEYFDEKGKNLRGAFLKSPVRFSTISSRYNLRRRIAYYGYKVRPHRGTDFAAPVGTPILATANGTVTESAYRGGNGSYVKIKHNTSYSTQYLHMKRKRNVKQGDYVKQGDVIGWVGMTGNTAGPHVCYRFWKNGKQVDPFLLKLPASEAPVHPYLKAKYDTYITPLKAKLDCIVYPEYKEEELIALN